MKMLSNALFFLVLAFAAQASHADAVTTKVANQIIFAKQHHLCYAPVMFDHKPSTEEIRIASSTSAEFNWRILWAEGKLITVGDSRCKPIST